MILNVFVIIINPVKLKAVFRVFWVLKKMLRTLADPDYINNSTRIFMDDVELDLIFLFDYNLVFNHGFIF